MTSVTVTISTEEFEALGYILEIAYSDQESYLSIGNPSVDYGDEWPSIAYSKATHFSLIAELYSRIGFTGERDRWSSLAQSFKASGDESQHEDNQPS